MGAYSDALHVVFWCQVGVAIFVVLACMGIEEVHLPETGKIVIEDDDLTAESEVVNGNGRPNM